MIFVTVGSQKFQFNRLLKKIDDLIKNGVIKDDVFAQIGNSSYTPKYYSFVKYMEQKEFKQKIDECALLITHAGTGVIINAAKKGKKIIAVPRLKKYDEHVDDHQLQLLQQFEESGMIEPAYDIDELEKKIAIIKNKKYRKYKSNTDVLLNSIESFINRGE